MFDNIGHKIKTLAKVLVLTLILTSCCAYAEYDVHSLSTDELITLQASIQSELLNRIGTDAVKVDNGYYEVGIDIPAGKYTIICVSPSGLRADYMEYQSREYWVQAHEQGYYPDFLRAEFLRENQSYSITLYEGMYVYFGSGSYYIKPRNPLF